MEPQEDIVIIGAGFAGLGAAITLQAANKQCIIVEAENAPGGRIRTLNVGNTHIDLGAQWMHGDDTKLYKIMEENDLIHAETSTEGDGVFLRDDGSRIDEFLVKRVDFEVGKILERAQTFVDFSYAEFRNVEVNNVGDFLKLEFEKFLEIGTYTKEEKISMRDIYDWHVRFQEIDNSCKDLKQLSLKEWGRYECPTKGEVDGQQHINIKGGYKALVDVLVGKLRPNSIKYNKAVRKIEIQNYDGQNSSLNHVLLTFEDDSQLWANQIILTSSLGILKSLQTSNNLVLPPKMSKTIASMGFDGMGKIFLEFEAKFWSTNIQIIWRNSTSIFTNLPIWLRYITGFETVLDQNNMLLAWVGHAGVEEMERLDTITVGEHCIELLRIFLKNEALPTPKNVYKSSWLSNQYVKGSYSFATPVSDDDVSPGRILAEPVCDKDGNVRILLAGEAVHSECFSTTHGAFESGVQQGNKLLK